MNIIRMIVTQDQERMVKIFSMMTPTQEKKRKTKPLLEVTRVKPKKKFVVVEKRNRLVFQQPQSAFVEKENDD